MTAVSVQPQGPKPRFLMGNIPDMGGDILSFYQRCAREYGDVSTLYLGYQRCYLINNPDYIEEIMVTNPRNFLKGAAYHTYSTRRLFGNGLLTAEGDEWMRNRRMMQPGFNHKAVGTYAGIMTDYTERMLARWQAGETRDIHEDMAELTLQIVTKALFDADVENEARETGRLFNQLLREFNGGFSSLVHQVGEYMPAYLPWPGRSSFDRIMKRLDEVIYGIIHQRRADKSDHHDVLSILLQAQDEDGSRMTDRQLRDEVMTLFFAGHETTALALSWTFYLLAQHPEVEQKLVDEISATLGERSPGLGDLPNLTYNEQVVTEGMRLYPPVWSFTREAKNDCEIGGYKIPGGSQILISQWVMQRDPRYWEQPEAFKPERWTAEMKKALPRYAYFPFGGGPRICIGNHFALMEAQLVLAAVMQKFHLEVAPNQTVAMQPSMSLRPREGIKMTLQPRRVTALQEALA